MAIIGVFLFLRLVDSENESSCDVDSVAAVSALSLDQTAAIISVGNSCFTIAMSYC